jgi:hypothetical protein
MHPQQRKARLKSATQTREVQSGVKWTYSVVIEYDSLAMFAEEFIFGRTYAPGRPGREGKIAL